MDLSNPTAVPKQSLVTKANHSCSGVQTGAMWVFDHPHCILLLHVCCDLFTEVSTIELVPDTCCRRTTYDWEIIINTHLCQTTQGGPPRTPVGSPNHFLNYEVNRDTGQAIVVTSLFF